MEIDWSKSLQELENEDWGDPKHKTRLVERCHQLRRVPLKDLTAEDCRLLLGQRIGAPYLVPVAIEFLQENPMEGGTMVPGVLLKNVLSLGQEFWQKHPIFWFQLKEIVLEVDGIRQGIEDMNREIVEFEGLEKSIVAMGSAAKPT